VLEFGLQGTTPGYKQVLDEIAETGYAGTDLGDWGFLPTDATALRAALGRRGLALISGFVPVALVNPRAHADGEDAAVRIARLLREAGGEECLIVLADENATVDARTRHAGRVTPEMALSDDEWRTFAAGADRVARTIVEQTGLRTVFHHHCGGYVETPAEVDRLVTSTNPELLGLCLDTGHFAWGGGDPRTALCRYGDRIWHVHFKDVDPAVRARARIEEWGYFEAVENGVFCELGQGQVDFPGIADVLSGQGYEGWIVVEQDVLPSMGSPKASAQRNRDCLRSIGL
jgi:inosose dehydratase